MKITPLSIKRQEFKRNIRGYDPDEVNTFLEIIADEFDQLLKQNEELTANLTQMQKKLQEYQQIEKSLQQTLLAAQETSARSMEASKRQAVLLIKEAEIKAKQIVEKAQEEAKAIQNSVLELEERKRTLISRLKAVIQAHIQLLNSFTEEYSTVNQQKEKDQTKQIDVESIINRIS